MLSENLKTLRTRNGLSQEQLASRLHVVRQTVSKWEKGLSVPDADMLMRIADIFNVPISALLGADLGDAASPDKVAVELAKIAEQLAVKNRRARRIWKTVAIVLVAVLIFNIIILYNSLSLDPHESHSRHFALRYDRRASGAFDPV